MEFQAALPQVEVTRTTVILPTYEPLAARPQPDVPGKAGVSGVQRKGLSPSLHRTGSRRKPKDRAWEAVYIQNEFIRVMILPELHGGRIHRAPGQDKRLRPHLLPAGDQARARRPRGSVGERWHRVQLAATSPPVDVYARRRWPLKKHA